MGSVSLHQGIFPTQRLNPGLPHCRQILSQLSLKGHTVISQIVDCTGLLSCLLLLLCFCRQSVLKEALRVIWLKKCKAECVTPLLKILQLLPMFFRMKVLYSDCKFPRTSLVLASLTLSPTCSLLAKHILT